jgi:hypothetical protein
MRVGVGFRDHSGWAVVVAAGFDGDAPVVLDRRRVELCPEALPRQPYHAAVDLPLDEAAALIARVDVAARAAAAAALAEVTAALDSDGHEVVGVAVAAGTTRLPDDLGRTLGSHPLLHAGEGELYREAIAEAASGRGLPVIRFVQRQLWDGAATRRASIGALGKALGPPWTADQKDATGAALLVLD